MYKARVPRDYQYHCVNFLVDGSASTGGQLMDGEWVNEDGSELMDDDGSARMDLS